MKEKHFTNSSRSFGRLKQNYFCNLLICWPLNFHLQGKFQIVIPNCAENNKILLNLKRSKKNDYLEPMEKLGDSNFDQVKLYSYEIYQPYKMNIFNLRAIRERSHITYYRERSPIMLCFSQEFLCSKQ